MCRHGISFSDPNASCLALFIGRKRRDAEGHSDIFKTPTRFVGDKGTWAGKQVINEEGVLTRRTATIYVV